MYLNIKKKNFKKKPRKQNSYTYAVAGFVVNNKNNNNRGNNSYTTTTTTTTISPPLLPSHITMNDYLCPFPPPTHTHTIISNSSSYSLWVFFSLNFSF